jgi:tetratricopeptide (TPR) repeat protein
VVLLEEAPELTRHFRGREQEVESCLAALRSSRLVTITGLAGAGKTELSLAVAQKALADPALQPQRALWLLLAGVRGVEEIAGRLALAFGVSHAEEISAVARAVGTQRVFLLLDNAEDLIGTARLAIQRFCGELLRLCPGLRFLLTSRRLLGDVLGCEEIEVQVGRLRPQLALEVFRSATAARLSPEELASPDLEALVQALDGHPRSLILVAGQARRGVSLADLRRRLELDGDAAVMAREFQGETKPGTDADLRTKRLISSLNLSYEPLASDHPAAAELFLWLGLFPAGLLLKAIPDIFGEAATKHRNLLLDFSLAEIDEGDAPRLFLPSPVRWYAKRRLGEVAAERQAELLTLTLRSLGRHLGTAMEQSWTSNAPQSLGLALREEPNLASLLPKACNDLTGDPARAKTLAEALTPWMYLMSRIDRPAAALLLGEQAAAAISQASPGTSAEAQLLEYLGYLYVRTARLREAEDAYQSALPIYQQIEDRLGEANTLRALGDLYVRTDRLREAEDAYQSALPIYQQIEDRLGEANTLQGLGQLAQTQGDLASAFGLFLQALDSQRSISDLLGEAGSFVYLARATRAASRLERAVALGGQAWRIYRRIESLFGQRLILDDQPSPRRSSSPGIWPRPSRSLLPSSAANACARSSRTSTLKLSPCRNGSTKPNRPSPPQLTATSRSSPTAGKIPSRRSRHPRDIHSRDHCSSLRELELASFHLSAQIQVENN